MGTMTCILCPNFGYSGHCFGCLRPSVDWQDRAVTARHAELFASGIAPPSRDYEAVRLQDERMNGEAPKPPEEDKKGETKCE